MKKGLLLVLGMACGFAMNVKAEFNQTNFHKMRYELVHSRYYNQTNTFYVAPLAYTVTGQGEVAVSGADLNAVEIEIPEEVCNGGKTYKVSSIHGYAFCRCSQLETLTIAKTVKYIYTSTLDNMTVYANGPFMGCKKLQTINCKAMKAPGFWNADSRQRNFFSDFGRAVTINTPEGSDYTAWAPYVDGLGLNVAIPASGFGSYFINKDLQIPTDKVENIYILKQVGTDISYEPLKDGFIPANTAVLIKGKANSYATFRTTTIPSEVMIDVTGNLLTGFLTAEKAVNEQYYGLEKTTVNAEATFTPVIRGSYMQKNEAYLSANQLGSSPTAIRSITTNHQGEELYDLNGRQVKNTLGGIYINKTGKKEYKK